MQLNHFIQLSLKKKIILSSAVFAVGLLSIIYFVVIPTIKGIKTIKNEIETQKIDLEKKYIKGQNLKKVLRNMEIMRPQLKRQEKIFINKSQALEFVTSLEKVADRYKINQKINLVSSQGVQESAYEKIPLQIFVNGSFLDELKYLINLEAMNYAVNIKLLSIASASSYSGSNINMTILADTFWKH